MIVWAWCSLAWVASVAFWVIVVFARERRLPGNYRQLCEALGLCALWPATIALEIALTIAARREKKRHLDAQEAALVSGNTGR